MRALAIFSAGLVDIIASFCLAASSILQWLETQRRGQQEWRLAAESIAAYSGNYVYTVDHHSSLTRWVGNGAVNGCPSHNRQVILDNVAWLGAVPRGLASLLD
jgi:hypothetical protein